MASEFLIPHPNIPTADIGLPKLKEVTVKNNENFLALDRMLQEFNASFGDIGKRIDAMAHDHPYAPEKHVHQLTDVEGLIAALEQKAPLVHDHPQYLTEIPYHVHDIVAVNGLIEALADKANAQHVHNMNEVNGLLDALNAKADLQYVGWLEQEIAKKGDLSNCTKDLLIAVEEVSAGWTSTRKMLTTSSDFATHLNAIFRKEVDSFHELDGVFVKPTYVKFQSGHFTSGNIVKVGTNGELVNDEMENYLTKAQADGYYAGKATEGVASGAATAAANALTLAQTASTNASQALSGLQTLEGTVSSLQTTVGGHTTSIESIDKQFGIVQQWIEVAGALLQSDVEELKTDKQDKATLASDVESAGFLPDADAEEKYIQEDDLENYVTTNTGTSSEPQVITGYKMFASRVRFKDGDVNDALDFSFATVNKERVAVVETPLVELSLRSNGVANVVKLQTQPDVPIDTNSGKLKRSVATCGWVIDTALAASSPTSTTDWSSPGSSSALATNTWTAGGETGLLIPRHIRTVCDLSSAVPELFEVYRVETYDKLGRLYSVSKEYRNHIDFPTVVNWSA